MMKLFRTLFIAAAVFCANPLVFAAQKGGYGPGAVRDRAESSLLVRGEVHVEPDGSVSAMHLDQEDRLPKGIATLVQDSVKHWKFDPVLVEGKAVPAKSPMSLRVVAKKLDDDRYELRLSGVSFDEYSSTDPQNIASTTMRPPSYPDSAVKVGASGNVYLIVKVGRDGLVQDAFAEQVNLRIVTSESDQRRLRNMFARSAIAAAKTWSFRVPTEGKAATQPYWSARIPVQYSFQGQPTEGLDKDYGRWISYIPGPRERAPWVTEEDFSGFSPDTLGDGGVYLAGNSKLRLLTPLQGG